MEHDFYGHEVNGIHGVNGKKCYDRAFHLANKLHDFTGMHYLSGKFCFDDFFRKTNARLYIQVFSLLGIDFVKSKDERLAKNLAGIYTTPALVYFRKKIPVVYDGGMVATVTT